MDGLREHGYLDGQNVHVEFRYAEGQADRFPALVADLLGIPVDVIVASTSPAVVASKAATSSVPIVMVGVGDAIGPGLVESLSHPGGNVTGVTSFSPELSSKRLALIKEMVPNLDRVAVLWNMDNPVKALDWQETELAAATLALRVMSHGVRQPLEIEAALETAVSQGCQALVVLGDPLTVRSAERIAGLAVRYGLPAIYEGKEFVDAGGLISYAASRESYYRRAAFYVAKILQGANPAELPVERPSRFEMVLNMRAAEQISLTVPNSVLLQAQEVVR